MATKSERIQKKDDKDFKPILDSLCLAKTLPEAKELAVKFFDSLRSQDKASLLKIKLERIGRVEQVVSMCYNALLSGERMGVLK